MDACNTFWYLSITGILNSQKPGQKVYRTLYESTGEIYKRILHRNRKMSPASGWKRRNPKFCFYVLAGFIPYLCNLLRHWLFFYRRIGAPSFRIYRHNRWIYRPHNRTVKQVWRSSGFNTGSLCRIFRIFWIVDTFQSGVAALYCYHSPDGIDYGQLCEGPRGIPGEQKGNRPHAAPRTIDHAGPGIHLERSARTVFPGMPGLHHYYNAYPACNPDKYYGNSPAAGGEKRSIPDGIAYGSTGLRRAKNAVVVNTYSGEHFLDI